MANDDFPLKIPKIRRIKLGEGNGILEQERITVDMQVQGVADVGSFVRNIIVTDTEQQMSIGNPPQITVVDGNTDKSIEDVEKKAVVIFGVVLATEAMALVERTLGSIIQGMGLVHTGRLASLSNWQWLFKQRGKTAVPAPVPLPSFSPGDLLIYYPFNVPHASWANWRAKAMAQRGFMAQTTAAVRKFSVFRQFSVAAMFTSAYSVPGDTYPHGTPIIVIRSRIRRGG